MQPAEATVWHQEQKTQTQTEYYLIIRDGEKNVSLIVKHDSATNSVSSDIYTSPDINYTIHDGCNHDEDLCVLDDPDSPEYEDVMMADRHSHAIEALERQVKQAKIASALLQRKQERQAN